MSKFKKDSTGWQEKNGNKPDLVGPRYNWKLRDLEIIVLGHCSFILNFSSKLSMTPSQQSLSNHNVYLTYWRFYSSIWPLSQAQLWLNSPTTLADKATDCLSSICKFQKGSALWLSLPLPLFPLEAFCKPSPPLFPLYFPQFFMFQPWLVLLLLLFCTAQLQLSTLDHGRTGSSKQMHSAKCNFMAR